LINSPSSTGEAGLKEGFDPADVQAIHIQIDPGGAHAYDVTFHVLKAQAEGATPVAAPISNVPTYKTLKDYAYTNDRENSRYTACLMDVYYPENVKDFPTVVFIHAGGLKQGQRYIPGELMNQGFAVVSISYSLYPKAKSPEFIEDAAASVAWVFKNIENVGGSADKIFVSGSSAGGYLAMMVGLDKQWLAEYEIDANRLAGIISLSGQAITHVAIREERGGHRAKPVVDELAPLNHVRGDAPPLLIVTGDRELELLGRYEENAYLKRMMEINGHKATQLHEIKGADHAGVEKPGHEFLKEFVKRVAGM
jgi:acetyl esterase/lipase